MPRVRRTALAGMALAISLTGCASPNDPQAGPAASVASPTPSLTGPQSVVAPVVAALKQGDYAFTVDTVTSKTNGVVHWPSQSASYVQETALRSSGFTVIGPDQYLRLGLGDDTWKHYDQSRPDRPFTAPYGDVVGVISLFDTVASARADGTALTGTFDLTKFRNIQIWPPDQIAEMGPAAQSVAFKATVDAEQRLSTLTVDVPATRLSPKYQRVFTLTGYGQQRPQTKPTGEIIEG